MKHPIILLNCNYDRGNNFRPCVNTGYVQSVRLVGGLPLLVPFQSDDDDIEVALDAGHALIMTGGADIDPAHYGEARHAKTTLKYEESQRFDLDLVRRARRRHMPVLGICLGIQQLNVALGGALYQDIDDQLGSNAGHTKPPDQPYRPSHMIRVAHATRLHRILGEPQLMVNSSHHQAVRTVAPGLTASAWSSVDGVIEAVEDAAEEYFIGVQWHPEEMAEPGTVHLKLFEYLVQAAAKFANKG